MGESYVITQAVYAAVVVLMMNPIRFTAEGVAKKTGEIILAVISLFLMNGFIYMTVGETHKNWLLLLIYIVLYAGIRSKYRYSTRVIMGSVFYSAAFLNIVISEPWGDLISALGFPAYGYMGITTIVNILLFVFMGWYLKRFPAEKFSFEPGYGVALMLVISSVAGASQIVYDWMADDRMQDIRLYNMLISSGFLVLELLVYYMLYVISKEYTENVELLAMQQKAELDREMYIVTKNIYQEMSAVRYEIKNHDAYMRALLEKKGVSQAGGIFEQQYYVEESGVLPVCELWKWGCQHDRGFCRYREQGQKEYIGTESCQIIMPKKTALQRDRTVQPFV